MSTVVLRKRAESPELGTIKLTRYRGTRSMRILRMIGLTLLAAALPKAQLSAQTPPGSSGLFNVRNFGAKGDGKALDPSAVSRAIDTCAAAGGGTVYFPAGNYISGTIHLKSNVTLWI